MPEHVPMRFEDYLALSADLRAEYVDGGAVLTPPPTAGHQRVARRIANALEAGAPGLFVVEASGARTGEQRGRIPDVLATTAPYDAPWAPEAPVVVVEALSPGTRADDLGAKASEHLDAGVGQSWLVDRERPTLSVLTREGARWTAILELDPASSRGVVDLGDHGAVPLDLTVLLAP